MMMQRRLLQTFVQRQFLLAPAQVCFFSSSPKKYAKQISKQDLERPNQSQIHS